MREINFPSELNLFQPSSCFLDWQWCCWVMPPKWCRCLPQHSHNSRFLTPWHEKGALHYDEVVVAWFNNCQIWSSKGLPRGGFQAAQKPKSSHQARLNLILCSFRGGWSTEHVRLWKWPRRGRIISIGLTGEGNDRND